MNTIKRRLKILELLKTERSVKISQLTELFQVSRVTVRADLDELERKGLLIRTRGGALHPENLPLVRMLMENLKEKQDEKEAICRAAMRFIKSGMNIIIDTGSTMVHLARLVSEMNITVTTNSVLVLDELRDAQSVEVFVAGGMLRRPYMSLMDTATSFMFDQIHADILFLGCPGFSVNKNITTTTIIEAETKKQMIKSASMVCLLADSSKKDKMFMANVCGWDSIDYFITDALTEEDIVQIAEYGVQTIIAKD
ncbi:DeoR/GlpR family DNA-binding transcription regulator [Breznakiella homolactica]|uniref:DeoR/GlpR transcriptional regulator n=1 Tax=Breznakiella homolactica TaxID=2798577 RepID=A0A7T7XRI4_9SPIR|nr:DeoR/GlpR family DNA-binding transcription regulator [Breznakiella homolactica]QQO11153.1 DeoR/GlpR family DNA-binding transcription regulator [Breznakiella homolactica]